MQLNSPSPGTGLEMKQEGFLWGTWLSMETRHHIHHPHTLDKHHPPANQLLLKEGNYKCILRAHQ